MERGGGREGGRVGRTRTVFKRAGDRRKETERTREKEREGKKILRLLTSPRMGDALHEPFKFYGHAAHGRSAAAAAARDDDVILPLRFRALHRAWANRVTVTPQGWNLQVRSF